MSGYEIITDTFDLEHPFFSVVLQILNLSLNSSIAIIMVFLFARIIILSVKYATTFGDLRRVEKVKMEMQVLSITFVIQLSMISTIKLLIGGQIE